MNVNRRTRRTPEEARTLILETAERRLAEMGLEGLNVVGLAKAAGISHATLLHHFGSADEMRQALVQRMSERLITEAVAAIGDNDEITAVMRELFDVFSTGGHAKLLAWLAIEEGQRPVPSPAQFALFDGLIRASAESMLGGDIATARNLLTLVVSAAIGLGVAGGQLMDLVGMDEADRRVFPDWLAGRIGLRRDDA
ncbi:MAG: TetR/AcrR family transcriptional regulator [Pseudomonadales bacterium]